MACSRCGVCAVSARSASLSVFGLDYSVRYVVGLVALSDRRNMRSCRAATARVRPRTARLLRTRTRRDSSEIEAVLLFSFPPRLVLVRRTQESQPGLLPLPSRVRSVATSAASKARKQQGKCYRMTSALRRTRQSALRLLSNQPFC